MYHTLFNLWFIISDILWCWWYVWELRIENKHNFSVSAAYVWFVGGTLDSIRENVMEWKVLQHMWVKWMDMKWSEEWNVRKYCVCWWNEFSFASSLLFSSSINMHTEFEYTTTATKEENFHFLCIVFECCPLLCPHSPKFLVYFYG